MSDDWKNHPVIIAAISCASTAAFFVTVVQPMTEKHNENKILSFKEKISTLESSISEQQKQSQEARLSSERIISNKEKEIGILKSSIEILKEDIEKYKNEDRFSLKNPIPKGFREIKIFTPYNKIKTTYPDFKFNEDTFYSSVEIDDKLFSSATYYPAKCNNKKIVNEIRFGYRTILDDYNDLRKKKDFDFLKNPVPSTKEIEESRKQKREAIIKIFNEKFGNPIETKEKNETIYIVDESTATMVDENFLYIFSRYDDDDINKICSSAN